MTANFGVKTRGFILKMFVIGSVFGTISAYCYVWYVQSQGRWEPSTSAFHAAILFWGLGFIFPCLTISLRIMYQSLMMGHEGLEAYRELKKNVEEMKDQILPIIEKTNIVVDKIIPMTENIHDVVTQAQKMSEDVVSIAHKTRGMLEHMNGSLDVKVLSDKLDRVGDNLERIAKAFAEPAGGFKASDNGDVAIPELAMQEFDPTKLPARRRRI